MKRIALCVVVGVLLITMIPGVASAATFTCFSVPCNGTNHADTIFEFPANGFNDIINGRGGSDTIRAEDFTNDRDRLFGGSANDRINARDNDNRDFVSCGKGKHDVAILDKGDNVNHRNCESIRRG